MDAPLAWAHLAVIGAIRPDGKLFQQVYEHAISNVAVVRCWRHLLRHLNGKLTGIWDGVPAHRRQLVKDFLVEGAAERLHLVQLPG